MPDNYGATEYLTSSNNVEVTTPKPQYVTSLKRLSGVATAGPPGGISPAGRLWWFGRDASNTIVWDGGNADPPGFTTPVIDAIPTNVVTLCVNSQVAGYGQLTYQWGYSNVSICPYGTEANPDASTYTVFTSGFIDIIAALLGLGPLGILALDVMIGSPILAYDCTQPPPAPPTITDADFLFGTAIPNPSSIGKFADLARIGVWHFYCQCKPAPSGSPAPAPYPPPSNLPPTLTTGAQPPTPCDESDICSILNQISRQLTILQTQNNTYITNTMNQYNTTNVNPPPIGPSGSPQPVDGTLGGTALGIHGITVTLTSVPSSAGVSLSDPTAYFHAGWVHVGNDYGWRRGVAIHVSPQWIDLEPGDTRWGVALAHGYTAVIQPYKLTLPSL